MKKKKQQIRLTSSDILFEDENYIAIYKKQGWVVHETSDPNRSNLFQALKSFLKQRDRLQENPYLTLHHRLDVDTSGIILFGKTKETNKVLSDIFSKGLAIKRYQAICHSPISSIPNMGTFEDFLKKEKRGKREVMVPVKSGGQKTITKYQILKSHNDFHLFEFELVTGRMHQLRVQSSLRGYPILGDQIYGDKELNSQFNFRGQLLHAYLFKFYDPLSDREISIECQPWFELEKIEIGGKKSVEDLTIIFNKPYNVLCQFTKDRDEDRCLKDFNLPEGVYPAGRLDKDSEGLLILSNNGELIHQLSSPKFEKQKTYWVQVENIPTPESLEELRTGVTIKGGYRTLPCEAKILEGFTIEERDPPIRKRKNVPTCWLEIKIKEGKNRQVRRMTAAIGHPTLRLIRQAIGEVFLTKDLKPGDFILWNNLLDL